MSTQQDTIPSRQEVSAGDTWNLTSLFADDAAWEQSFSEFKDRIPEIGRFQGTLATSVDHLFACLEFMTRIETTAEKLGVYAHLRLSEDAGDSKNQERFARYVQAATQMAALASYQSPEIQAIPEVRMNGFLQQGILREYRIPLNKLLRYRPHILSEPEERLLAMQEEANQTAHKSFSALTDVDMEFGTIKTPDGERPLSQATYGVFLLSPNRELRRQAFKQFLVQYDRHRNTLASLYAGSVHLDVYKARIRNFSSSRAAHLFSDDVPESVYDNLIATVHESLPTLHAYYRLRRKALGLADLQLYDVKTPLVPNVDVRHSYEQAVEVVIDALRPLGDEYGETLRHGLLGGWVDRYENRGKRSGAFSSGSYAGDPHILLNYNEDDLRDVFTIAHEGGHSMHSWYSVRNNPFQYYEYTIFEAEVASTFNEQLLLQHLLQTADDEPMRGFLVNKHVDDIVATLFRQTMFAEFEKRTHEMVESGVPLTVDSLREEYRKLLEIYFGPDVVIEPAADLEGLRIPHFYRAFYVYKYATGISAAISLAQRVLEGGKEERDAYFRFLKSGGSRFPIESLKLAGVDMATPLPVQNALQLFRRRVDQLSEYLGLTQE